MDGSSRIHPDRDGVDDDRGVPARRGGERPHGENMNQKTGA